MKRKLKWLLFALVALIVVAALGGFIYFKYFFTLDLFKEGPTTEVNLAGWQKLEKGMTKPQVVNLLGDSSVKYGPGTYTLGGATNTTPETWEYNWTVGFSWLGEVHPKAYVVYFGDDGKLALWREPLETNTTEKTDSRSG
jgi:hypothetical protein